MNFLDIKQALDKINPNWYYEMPLDELYGHLCATCQEPFIFNQNLIDNIFEA